MATESVVVEMCAKNVAQQPKKGMIGFFNSLSRRMKLVLICVIWLDFLNFSTVSVLAPFFPVEAAKKGMNPSVSGLVFGCFAFTDFLSCFVFGKLIPLLGLKRVLVSGLALSGTCNIVFGLLDRVNDLPTFTALCFVVRTFEALGAAAFFTSTITLLATLFPNNVGTVMGILQLATGLGLSIGPGIGGVLYGWGGYQLPFLILGAFILANIPFLIFNVHSDQDVQPKSGRILDFLKCPAAMMVAIMVVPSAVIWTYFQPTLALHLQQFELSPQLLGLFFVWMAAIYVMFCPICGSVADGLSRTWPMIAIGLMTSAVGFLLIGPSPILSFLPSTIWLNLVSLAIVSISCGIALIPTYQAIMDYATFGGMADDLSTYSIVGGVWTSMFHLGDALGPSFGGFLLERYGFPLASTIMAAMTFALGLMMTLFFVWWHHWQSFSWQHCWRPRKTDANERQPLKVQWLNKNCIKAYN